ncbi:response regulator [Teredinibacter franksiae]|uniref:response regulator n=1 Tax=Teredinibacter franksiae TaxID=2761453 RepID=UPI0016233205|nr:response regulator [Teredinibacter franksiae]
MTPASHSQTRYRIKRPGNPIRWLLVVAPVLLGILLVFADWSNNRMFEQAQRSSALQELSVIRARLEGNINANLQTGLSLAAIIGANSNLNQDVFSQYAKSLFRGHTQLRNIAAAPDMVIRYMYPLKGNEAAVNLDYRAVPEQWSAIQTALDSGDLVLAGPVNLKQGGQGLIGRVPVFNPNVQTGEPELWGLVAVVINLQEFYRESGLIDGDKKIEIAIRGLDGKGDIGHVFWGRLSLFEQNPVTDRVSLPHGYWRIAAIPEGGWSPRADNAWQLRGVGVFILISFCLGTLFIDRLISRRREQDVRLNGLFDLSPIGIALNDFNTGTFLELNQAIVAPSGYSTEEFKLLSFRDLTPAEFEPAERQQLQRLLQTGRYGPYEKEYIRKDGSRYPVVQNGVMIQDGSGRKLIWSMVEDISERKKSQLELVDSKAQLQNFFDLSNNFMSIANLDGYFEKINQTFIKVMGFTEDDFFNIPYIDFIHPDDVPETLKEIDGLSAGRSIIGFVNRFRRKDGSYIYLKWHAAPEPTTGKMYSMAMDITKEKENESKLQRQQEMLESMSEQAHIGAWEINLQAKKVYWSDMTKKIHDVEPEFKPQMDSAFSYYKPGKSQSIIEHAMQMCSEQGVSFNEELQIVTAKGRDLWVAATGKAEFEDDRCIRLYGSFQDINARKIIEGKVKQTKMELEQQMHLLRVITETQASFIERSDVEVAFNYLLDNILSLSKSEYGFIGEILYLESGDPYLKIATISNTAQDESARAYFEQQAQVGLEFYNMDNLFGAAILSLEPVIANDVGQDQRRGNIPEAHPPLHSFLGIPIRSGDRGLALVGIANRVGGYSRELIEWLHPLTNSIGQFVEGVREIRARQKAENELVEAKEAAEAAAQAKSDFLAMMSHEIRTPLNGVMGMINLLSRSGLNAEQDRKLKIASHSSSTLLNIINDILDFSKVEAGKIDLEMLDFNLLSMMNAFGESMAIRAEERGLELIVDLSGIEHPMVNGDQGRIRQILSNLVGNAIKFTESGEIVVRVGVTPAGDDLVLRASVTDSGIGIPKEKIEDLFNPFTQVDASTTRNYGGTGLGLAISKKLCDIMGGDISAFSEPGSGSTFEFFLHLGRSEEIAQVPKMDLHNRKILVVEDNATNRELMRNTLEWWGASVNVTDSATTVVEYLEQDIKENQSLPDVIIIDQYFPGMSGQALARAIKGIEELSLIPLVIMSRISAGLYREFQQAGFNGHVIKPVSSSGIAQCLSVVLAGGSTLSDMKNIERVEASRVESFQLLGGAEVTRVLLVEDNPVNQEVAKMMLSDAGVVVDVAANGLEALRALEAANENDLYSLVFMDCQMPEMDGYESCRQIRAGKAGLIYRDVPVIAMTANAMKGDREKCIEAGMSDYISKPVEQDVLELKVKHWIKAMPAPVRPVVQKQALNGGSAIEPTVVDVEDLPEWGVDQLLEKLKGRKDRLKILLNTFVGRMPDALTEFDQAVAQGDITQIGFCAHSIKGSAAQLCGHGLAVLAANLEQAAKIENVEKVSELAPKFRGAIERFLRKLEDYLKGL